MGKKGKREGGRGESVRVIACVPVVSWILITKKNLMMEITILTF